MLSSQIRNQKTSFNSLSRRCLSQLEGTTIQLHGIDLIKLSASLPVYALKADYPDVEIEEHRHLVSTLESIASKEGEVGVVLEEIRKEVGLHGYRNSEGAKSLLEEGVKELPYEGSLQLGSMLQLVKKEKVWPNRLFIGQTLADYF